MEVVAGSTHFTLSTVLTFTTTTSVIRLVNISTRRASNILYSELRHIIIVGNITFIEREWMLLRNLPKISVMDGNPLNRADIRAVKVPPSSPDW